MSDEPRRPFKDYFDREAAQALADQLQRAVAIDRSGFLRRATRRLRELEMMDRVRQFSAAMRWALPAKIPTALQLLTKSLPPPLPNCERVTDGYLQWPVGQFIADYGTEHFEPSFEAMVELTQRFSSEFAIRPFVIRDPSRTFERLTRLTDHDSPHVRRWCSEGVRPRLPWGTRIDALVDDPAPILPILDALKDDPEEYVRRSVANNLNDIAKDHPALVVQTVRKWMAKKRRRLIEHALRTLIKDAYGPALELLGYGPPERISARLDISPKRAKIGESVTLSAVLENRNPTTRHLLVDYVVHYRKASGKALPKVFKWKQVAVPAQGALTLKKKQHFRPTTIRPLYPGRHEVELQVNGVSLAQTRLSLVS